MNGLRLAAEIGAPNHGLVYLGDGRAAVACGYSVGEASILVQSAGLARRPGSPVWTVRLDPRQPGDGPAYIVPAEVAARFAPLALPRVPPADALADESAAYLHQAALVSLADVSSERRYWIEGVPKDLETSVDEAPDVFGHAVGAVAGGTIRVVTTVLGGAAGAFYGALPLWLQIAIPVAVVGAGLAGAAAVVRSFRPPTPG